MGLISMCTGMFHSQEKAFKSFTGSLSLMHSPVCTGARDDAELISSGECSSQDFALLRRFSAADTQQEQDGLAIKPPLS